MTPSMDSTKEAKALKRKAAEAQVDANVAAFKAAKKTKKEKPAADKSAIKPVTPDTKHKKAKKADSTEAPTGTSQAAPEKQMSADEYRAKHDITVKGVPSPDVYQNFSDAPFPASLKNALVAAGFSSPSPIQVRAYFYRIPPSPSSAAVGFPPPPLVAACMALSMTLGGSSVSLNPGRVIVPDGSHD